jgi:parvulin-like peptidyl-prolyl isomerase
MLLSAYLFLVVLSFLFWLTAPEKAEALEIEKQKNFLQAEDSERVVREHLNQEDGRFSEFPITIEKINEIISNLNSRNARIVAQKLGIKQRIGKRKPSYLKRFLKNLKLRKLF